jgi:hypothetical protein
MAGVLMLSWNNCLGAGSDRENLLYPKHTGHLLEKHERQSSFKIHAY